MFAPHDPVTGLVDLRDFCQHLDVEIARAVRHGRPLSLALVALDRVGAPGIEPDRRHEKATLSAAGHLLERFLRAHDEACRADGGQFAVLLPETDVDGAFACFERLGLELDLAEVGPASGVGASVGIATLEAGSGAAELFGLAGQALDHVRAEGGGGAAVTFSTAPATATSASDVRS